MIGVTPKQFAAAFPFHLALGKDMRIAQCGDSFRKVCQVDPVGRDFAELFRVRHPPDVALTHEGLMEHAELLFVLHFLPKNVPFRGEFTASSTEGILLFLGSPWVVEHPGLSGLGLALADFALHDSLVDLLHLIQTQRTSLEESEMLARKLKEQQTALAEAHNQAEAANRTKSMFLANMSHELRTPLNSVLGFAQLMATDPDATARQQERLGIIKRSGKHLLDLLNDLLDLSKIEAGTMSLDEAPFAIVDLLAEIEDMFRPKSQAKNLGFTVSSGADVPKTLISDPQKLRQILLNLVGNAVKFTHQGSIHVHASWCPESVLELEVRDTGAGISQEPLETIFTPFERGDQEGANSEGAGLGLAICKRFVEHMGGRIWVKSEAGAGSTFTASIPMTATTEGVSDGPDVLDAALFGQAARREHHGLPLHQAEDDKRAIRESLANLLCQTGPEVESKVMRDLPSADSIDSAYDPTPRLPSEVLRSLADACSRLEFLAVQESLREIEKASPGSHVAFAELASTFRYEELERLAREYLASAIKPTDDVPLTKNETIDRRRNPDVSIT